MKTLNLRERMVEVMFEMGRSGLNEGASGNLSVRLPAGFLIMPSGIPYPELSPEDLVIMDDHGRSLSPERSASSEWRLHRDILATREEVDVVLHTHSPWATALACLRCDIPAFHYMVAVAGGSNIRCAPYATFGTQTLSDNAVVALKDRYACLLANHGMVAIAPNLSKALELAWEVERIAQQYLLALQAGEPAILEAEEMDRVVEKFKTYGKQS